jgi:hypothetical protein
MTTPDKSNKAPNGSCENNLSKGSKDNTTKPPETESPENCAICMEPMKGDNKKTLRCGHDQFCTSCIDEWIKSQVEENRLATCPICRNVIDPAQQVEPESGDLVIFTDRGIMLMFLLNDGEPDSE